MMTCVRRPLLFARLQVAKKTVGKGVGKPSTCRWLSNSAKSDVQASAEGGAPPPTTITFKQGASAATSGAAWLAIIGLVGVCGLYITKELMPTSMSPNSVFDRTFEHIRDNQEVKSRLGSGIKAYGGEYNKRKEGRRNFVENDQFVGEDGLKRIRVKFNLEGSRGKAQVYAEVSEKMSKGEFSYIILEQFHRGTRDAVALIDNRPVYTPGEMQDMMVTRLNSLNAKLYGHSNCQWTHRQIQEFGEYAERLTIYMCDKEENKAVCEKAKLPGYPCWDIKGQIIPSYRPIEDLQSICRGF